MTDKKIIAVLGATGAQGGGLARAILHDKASPFKVRAVTRDAGSDKAKELAALGAEVVTADVDDAASLERAFTGAHGAFCVTFYWAHFSPEKELARRGPWPQAAKRAGLQHVIWSTLEDTRKLVPLTDDRMPTLMGKYKVPHFDAKGEANHLFTARGRADDVSADLLLLGQPDLLRHGSEAGAGRHARASRCRWATRSSRASPPRTSASAPMASSRGRRVRRQDGRHRRRAPDRSADGRVVDPRAGAGSPLQRAFLPRCTAASDSRERTIWETCSSTSAISKRTSAARGISPCRGRSTPSCRRSMRGSRGTEAAFRSRSAVGYLGFAGPRRGRPRIPVLSAAPTRRTPDPAARGRATAVGPA